jgi:hypothetical protein
MEPKTRPGVRPSNGLTRMTRNETIDRIGAGLRQEIGTTVQAPLPQKMRELLAKLELVDLQGRTQATAPRCGTT